MDELEISGKKYISSKRASARTGYTKDYIGQLARSGKILATRVGRAWYVEENALLEHKHGDSNLKNANPTLQIQAFKDRHFGQKTPGTPVNSLLLSYRPETLLKTWSDIRYFDDSGVLFPPITKTAAPLLPAPSKDGEVKIVIRKEPIQKAPPGALIPSTRRQKVVFRRRQTFSLPVAIGSHSTLTKKEKQPNVLVPALLSCLILVALAGLTLVFPWKIHIAGTESTASAVFSDQLLQDLSQNPLLEVFKRVFEAFFSIFLSLWNSITAFLLDWFEILKIIFFNLV